MKLKREITTKINYVLDEFIPPIIRDSRLIMYPIFLLVYKKDAKVFFNFKKNAHKLTTEQIAKIYETISSQKSRQTDLNEACVREILKNICGVTVLEVGCGKGYLAMKIAKNHKVTATDIVIPKLNKTYKNLKFQTANIEMLPFKNSAFDTVVCTHTLEHIPNISRAVTELRRVAKKRLIIVVPKQKPYKYTFDLHLHFFPYIESLLPALGRGNSRKRQYKEIGGDLFYQEDFRFLSKKAERTRN